MSDLPIIALDMLGSVVGGTQRGQTKQKRTRRDERSTGSGEGTEGGEWSRTRGCAAHAIADYTEGRKSLPKAIRAYGQCELTGKYE